MGSGLRRAASTALALVLSVSGCAQAGEPGPQSAAAQTGSELSVDTKAWTLTAPAAGATNAVRLAFPEPMDRAQLDALRVVAPDGSPLAGDVFASQDGRRWQFTPTAAWSAGDYQLAAFGKTLLPFSVR